MAEIRNLLNCSALWERRGVQKREVLRGNDRRNRQSLDDSVVELPVS
jgi:hypothetical protein